MKLPRHTLQIAIGRAFNLFPASTARAFGITIRSIGAAESRNQPQIEMCEAAIRNPHRTQLAAPDPKHAAPIFAGSPESELLKPITARPLDALSHSVVAHLAGIPIRQTAEGMGISGRHLAHSLINRHAEIYKAVHACAIEEALTAAHSVWSQRQTWPEIPGRADLSEFLRANPDQWGRTRLMLNTKSKPNVKPQQALDFYQAFAIDQIVPAARFLGVALCNLARKEIAS